MKIYKNYQYLISLLFQRCCLAVFILLSYVTNSIAQNISLIESLTIIKEKSSILKSQKYNIDIYKTYIISAKTRPNPILNNQNLFLLNHNNLTTISSIPSSSSGNIFDSKNNQLWFQLTKPMQIGDLRNKKIGLAEKGYETSILDYEVSVSEVCLDIANRWLELWTIKRKLDVYTEVKDINDSILYFNKIKLDNGFITKNDYDRIELVSEIFNLKISTIRLEYNNSLAIFRKKLGLNNSVNIKEKDNVEIYIFPKTLDSLIELGLVSRPDIKVAKSNSQYYKKNILVQKALAYPYVEAGFIFNPQNSISYAGTYVTTSIPVFNRNQGGIKQSFLLSSQSESVIEGKEKKTISEITTAYNSYKANKEAVSHITEMTNKSNKIFSAVRYTYMRGNTSVLDLLEAEKSYLQLNLLFIENESNYRKTYIELLFYTGLLNKI